MQTQTTTAADRAAFIENCQVRTIGEGLFLVPSADPNTSSIRYRVDVNRGTCTCPNKWGKCWHLRKCRVYYQFLQELAMQPIVDPNLSPVEILAQSPEVAELARIAFVARYAADDAGIQADRRHATAEESEAAKLAYAKEDETFAALADALGGDQEKANRVRALRGGMEVKIWAKDKQAELAA